MSTYDEELAARVEATEKGLRRTAGLLFEGPNADKVSNLRMFDRAFDAAYESYQSALDFFSEDFEHVEYDEEKPDVEEHWVHKETGTKVFLVGD